MKNSSLIKLIFKNRETSLSCSLKEQGQRRKIFKDGGEYFQVQIETEKTSFKQKVIFNQATISEKYNN
jgi:hypothetical protein